MEVTPGQTYTLVVGAGGTGNPTNAVISTTYWTIIDYDVDGNPIYGWATSNTRSGGWGGDSTAFGFIAGGGGPGFTQWLYSVTPNWANTGKTQYKMMLQSGVGGLASFNGRNISPYITFTVVTGFPSSADIPISAGSGINPSTWSIKQISGTTFSKELLSDNWSATGGGGATSVSVVTNAGFIFQLACTGAAGGIVDPFVVSQPDSQLAAWSMTIAPNLQINPATLEVTYDPVVGDMYYQRPHVYQSGSSPAFRTAVGAPSAYGVGTCSYSDVPGLGAGGAMGASGGNGRIILQY